MTIYLDTNVLVAAVLGNHPHYSAAQAVLRQVHDRKAQGWISAHGAAEFYAVLTRLPLTPPVYPSEAWRILDREILPHFKLASLSAQEYRNTLRLCAASGWPGGRVYDALHIAAARKARCERIYTFNLRHFRELAGDLAGRICTP